MNNRFLRQFALLLVVVTLGGLCFIEAGAQTNRRRRTRRTTPRPVVTNPPIAPVGEEQDPNSGTERIISTADEASAETEVTAGATGTAKPKTTKSPEDREMQKTINALSNQVNRLNDKLGQMQETDKAQLEMERLTRAEQRAENLRIQQLDVESKLADLQSKLEGTEYSLKPENIERSAAGFGTTRPEEARDARRRALENERARLLAQIKILETSRTRLEQALVSADLEVDALRRKMEDRRAQESTGTTPIETRPTTNPPRPE
jgi:chromosome segregation ATPase